MQTADDPHPDQNLAGDAIELGEARWDPDRDTAHVPWHPPAWLRHGPKALAVVLLTLLALHVPGELPTGPGAPLWTATVQWDGVALGSGLVYLPEGSGGTTLVARDAWTGEEVWRRELTARVLQAIDLGNGIAAVLVRRTALDGTPTDTLSTIIRARTGEILLDLDGSSRPLLTLLGPTEPAGGHLLFEDRARGVGVCPTKAIDGGCRVLHLVSAADAEPVWSLVMPAQASFLPSVEDGMVSDFATVDVGGRVEFHDVATGAVTATMTAKANVTGGVLTADRLVLMTQDAGQPLLTGYDRRSLSQVWRTELPLGPLPGYTSWLRVYDCGDLVCADTESGTSVIDPGSGRLVLALTDRSVVNLGTGLVLSVGGPASSAPDQTVTIWEVARATAIAELPNASIVTWTDSGGRGLLARQGSEGTSFILVEASGATRMLGRVAEQAIHCQAQGELLVCLNLGRLIAWRLPV